MSTARVKLARDKGAAAVAEGTYLTDGTRLLQVQRVEKARVICEEGSVEYPELVSLGFAALAREWRVVEVIVDG